MSMELALVGRLLKNSIFPVLRVLLLAYVGLILVLYFNQSRMVYLPSRDVSETPRSLGLDFEEVELVTKDGVRLSGWFVPASSNKKVILFCHGNAGNISNRLSYLPIFHSLGLTAFLFDYRGYGRSEGTPDEEGTYADVEAAWRYLVERKKIDPKQIVVYGESLGGAIATYIAEQQRPGGLILASTYTSVNNLAQKIYPFVPIQLLSRFFYNSLERMPRIKSPVLIIHSIDDEIIPFSHGEALYKAANEPKMLVRLRGDHNYGFLDSQETYRSGIEAFVQKYL